MIKLEKIETERLLLKIVDLEDAELIYELLNSPKFISNVGDRNVHSLEEAGAYIQARMRPQFDKFGFGNYAIIRKPDMQKMGTCGLFRREGLEGVDIGFSLLPRFEKQGYAFEAAKKLMDKIVETYDLKLVNGITIPDNIASRRLLEKLGLVYIKMIRIPKDPVDLMLYSITF